MMKVPLAAIDRERVTRQGAPDRLYSFVKIAWSQAEPASFVDNWHLPLICRKLEAVSSGEIKRLLINVPPGTTKSLLVSVFWPLWEWTINPTTKWMFASYDPTLTARHARLALKVLQSTWWQERFETRLTELRPAATDYETVEGGFRFSTSVGGKATGRHVDIQVVDDPTKPHDVRGSLSVTKKALQAVSEWWKGTAASRRADAATFRRVIVMQRLHEDDLAGEMLREGGWEHVCLPMRYEPDMVCSCGNPDCTPDDPRKNPGELLWPARYPEEVVQHDEVVEMGPSVAAAQLQQRPTPATGGIFKKSWFRYWHTRPGVPVPNDPQFPCRDQFCMVLPESAYWIQSWDMAFKGNASSDFVAGGVWLKHGNNCFLVHQVNERLAFTESLRALRQMTERYPQAITKLIEDKANGPAVQDQLKDEIPGIVMVPPKGGKEDRAHAVSGFFEAGNVFIPHPDLAPWVPSYMAQMASFPRGVNDDMVDQTTQALLKLAPGRSAFLEAMRAARERKQDG